jgi:hypothetical protein
MLHPSGIFTIVLGFRLKDVKILPYCPAVENGIGEEPLIRCNNQNIFLCWNKFKFAYSVENSLSFQEIGSQKLCFVCPD